jgi:demethylmenaquinone methyltransferase / 2-methoxy-6-polyprenyl-1,4-benzoquinol methylase
MLITGLSDFEDKDKAWAENIRNMFGQIAKKYNIMNRLITFGQDQVWCRYVIRKAQLPVYRGRMLDIGTGTGSIAVKAKHTHQSLFVVAADFSIDMMLIGRANNKEIAWCGSDALELPFPDKTFDAVTSGYLVRNVSDLLCSFKEQVRVVRHGGKVVCLETSPANKSWFQTFARFYMNFVIPCLGSLISGHRNAYTYLPASSQAFKNHEQLAQIMRRAGLANVSYKKFMFGNIGVHTGTRP